MAANHPSMKLLGKADTNWTQEGAFQAMSGFLAQNESTRVDDGARRCGVNHSPFSAVAFSARANTPDFGTKFFGNANAKLDGLNMAFAVRGQTQFTRAGAPLR